MRLYTTTLFFCQTAMFQTLFGRLQEEKIYKRMNLWLHLPSIRICTYLTAFVYWKKGTRAFSLNTGTWHLLDEKTRGLAENVMTGANVANWISSYSAPFQAPSCFNKLCGPKTSIKTHLGIFQWEVWRTMVWSLDILFNIHFLNAGEFIRNLHFNIVPLSLCYNF